MLQYNPTVSGSLNITGSLQVSGDITGTVNGINITGLSQSVSTQLINVQVSTGSSDAKFETLSGVTSSALTRLTNIETKSASVDISISNINSITSSFSSRVSNLESKSSSVDISISNINSVTASNIARLSNLETKSSSVDISISSINTFTSSNDTKFTTLGTYTGSLDTKNTTLAAVTSSLISKTGSYATTGSNQFYGTQVFSGSVYIANDLVVQGSSSIQYISASSVSIGTNIVQLNTANPSVRFAGLTMIDSGSIGGSGSFLYDSLQDEFIFVHRGNGTNVTSSHFVLGPETYDSLGNETYLTCNLLTKGTGKEHLVDSNIFDNGTTICLNGNTISTGTLSGTTIYGSTAVCSPVGKFTTCIDAGSGTFSSSITAAGGTTITSANAQTTLNLNNTNACATIASAIYFNKNGTPKWGIGTDVYSNTGVNEIQIYDFTNDLIRAKFTTSGANIIGTLGVTCAATFSSCVTATQFNVSTSGGATQIYNTGGGHTVITNVTTNKDLNIQTSGTGAQYFNTAGADRLTIASTGAATFACSVGVGGAPTYPLEVIANIADWGFVTQNSNVNGYGAFIKGGKSDGTTSALQVNNQAGTGLFTIKGSGNVGIGSATPTNVLEIVKAQAATTTLYIENSNDAANAATEIRLVGNEGVPPLKNNIQISFVRGSGGCDWALGMPANCNDFVIAGGTNQGDGKPSLGTAERMRITSGGNVGIGNSAPGEKFVVQGPANNWTANFIGSTTSGQSLGLLVTAGTTTADHAMIVQSSSNITLLRIAGNGVACFAFTVCAPCFATISDYRMKSNVRPIEGLSIIMNTKPYKFEYNYDCSTSFGMIAHELQDTLPEAVFGQKDGEVMQGVDYMKLLPIAIKAIQEQQCTINLLKTCIGIS